MAPTNRIARLPSLSNNYDHFEQALAPKPNETPEEREARLVEERRAKELSDSIDREIEKERKALKAIKETKLLLLGPSEAGKTTFLKQLRLLYDDNSFNSERESYRLVILLTLVQAVRAMLSILEHKAIGQPGTSSSGRSTPGAPPTNSPKDSEKEKSEILLKRMRLSHVLGLEGTLRDKLGVVSGVSSKSFNQRGNYESVAVGAGPFSEISNKPTWRDSLPVQSAEPNVHSLNFCGVPEDIEEEEELENVVVHKPGKPHRTTSAGSKKSSQAQVNEGTTSKKGSAQNLKLEGPETYVLPSRWNKSEYEHSGMRRSKSFGYLRRFSKDEGGKDKKAWQPDPNDPIHAIAGSRDEIRKLWQEVIEKGLIAGEGVMKNKAGGFELNESSRYFLDHLDRVANTDFFPIDEDLLFCRVKTVGVEEHVMYLNSPERPLRVVDVAGARGTRHIWDRYFEDSEAIIFMVAVNTYNERLPEAPKVNRMEDALELFFNIASNPLLAKISIVLFLNKVDLLRRKVRSGLYPIKDYFLDFNGNQDNYQDILRYFNSRFKACVQTRERRVYSHFTTSTDIKLARLTISTLNDTVLRNNLANAGII